MSERRWYSNIDPKVIVINRDGRQRQENISEIEDLKQSIGSIGIINPVVVRQIDDKIVLVAGERRLKVSLELNLAAIPVRFFDDLSEEEAEVIELEENIKRKELSWRDQVRAIGRLHQLYKKSNNSWKIEQTADAVSLHHSYLRKILHVFEALGGGRIDRAESIDQAFNTLHRFSERKAENIVGDLIVKASMVFGTEASITETNIFTTVTAISVAEDTEDAAIPPTVAVPLVTIAPPISDPIVCANFYEWISAYNGPKFTLIHCDFPYGNYKGGDSQGALSALETEDFYDNTESIYWNLLSCLTENLDKIMSYSAHMVFWLQMGFYTKTVAELRKTGLNVHDHPLIWHKTSGGGGLGVAPGTEATHPRRTYDTALMCVRGNRPLVRSLSNSYAAPTVGNKIHPSQKSEPMLRYFLQMFVDETATVFDPTCGSGAALRAAEDLGAKLVLGLEMDPNYASTANTKTLQARILRQAGAKVRDDVA